MRSRARMSAVDRTWRTWVSPVSRRSPPGSEEGGACLGELFALGLRVMSVQTCQPVARRGLGIVFVNREVVGG